ncbi:MAG: response regulator transcription factor [Candidatus Gastranaerophilales bacterium]|nr:response regulator transcription factor [Candidatus Gastranaerophilales bacterium]
MDKNNILIVEDHALTSFALKASLSTLEYIDEVYDVNCAKDAYDILENQKIDLILMDLGLDEIDGVSAIHEIRKTNNSVKIIVLTSHCEKDEVLACLEAGISAYCSKDIKPDKLADVIKDVLSGSMYFDSNVSKYVMQTTSKSNQNDKFANISVKDCYNLTQQEKRVLILLSSGNNNSQIANKLQISINTTKVHVCSILQKMGVEDRTQAAIKAIRENLIV